MYYYEYKVSAKFQNKTSPALILAHRNQISKKLDYFKQHGDMLITLVKYIIIE